MSVTVWLRLVRPGDWLVFLAGAAVVAVSIPMFWQGGIADKAIVHQDGQVFAEIDLRTRR